MQLALLLVVVVDAKRLIESALFALRERKSAISTFRIVVRICYDDGERVRSERGLDGFQNDVIASC